MNDSETGPDLLNDLANEFAERYRRGERPGLSEYTEKHPELAAEIRDLFPAMAVMEELGSVAAAPEPPPRIAVSGTPVPRQLGDYRILREVGRGGMGIVYEAVQESLGRHVALKVLPFHSVAEPCQLERFRREARAAAMLHHTNIVPVFGIGEHEGVHYFAMQFIRGQALDGVLQELKDLRSTGGGDGGRHDEVPAAVGVTTTRPVATVTLAREMVTGRFAADLGATEDRDPAGPSRPDAVAATGPAAGSECTSTAEFLGAQPGETSRSAPPFFRSVARVGLQVSEAVAYAHHQGVLHRDIKPANILLDTEGTAWVTDFGLAKADGSGDLTGSGDLVGTLRYMAPERFRGQSDPRSDVFSLGLTLYEMATLRPAYAAAERAQLIARMLNEEPPRPRSIDRRIPRDLETVILKAIAREPGQRYQTAGALAEDLRRFVADRPVLARRSTWPERFVRWCRRNPAIAGLSATAAALLVVAVVALAVSNIRIAHSRDEKATALKQEQKALAAARSSADAARVEKERATENLRKARRAVDQMLTRVSEERLFLLPQLEQVRRALLEDATTLYQEFLQQNTNDPRLRLEAAQIHRRLGQLQRDLGQSDAGIASNRRAVDLLTQLVVEFPRDLEFRSNLAEACESLAFSLAVGGKPAEAEPYNWRALSLFHALATEDPAGFLRMSAEGHSEELLSWTLNRLERYDDAEKECRKGLSILEKLIVEDPASPDIRGRLGNCLRALAASLVGRRRFSEAEAVLRRALEVIERHATEFPSNREWQHIVVANRVELANSMIPQGNRAGAAEQYLRALAIERKLAADFPGIKDYQDRFNECLDALRRLVGPDLSPEVNVRIGNGLVKSLESLPADHPDYRKYRIRLAEIHAHLGERFQERGLAKEAEAAFRSAITVQGDLVRALPSDPEQAFRLVTYQSSARAVPPLDAPDRRGPGLPPGDHPGGSPGERTPGGSRLPHPAGRVPQTPCLDSRQYRPSTGRRTRQPDGPRAGQRARRGAFRRVERPRGRPFLEHPGFHLQRHRPPSRGRAGLPRSRALTSGWWTHIPTSMTTFLIWDGPERSWPG